MPTRNHETERAGTTPSHALVHFAGQQITTDSRIVAKALGKLHKNVLRDVRQILTDVPAEFAKLNFELCSEISCLQYGKPQPYYRLSKDGFMLLVMGFTGPQAMAMKIAFIDAFNAMAEFIRAQGTATLAAFNRAMQQHPADKRHISHCGRDMAGGRSSSPPSSST